MEERDEERKSTTSLWLDGFREMGMEKPAPKETPKNWVQFAALSVVLKLKSTVHQKNVKDFIRTMVNRIHSYMMDIGTPNIKILAGMTPKVKLAKKQVVTAFYGYAIDNPENNPVLPVKLFRPIVENMIQGSKQLKLPSWKYAGLLENSDIVRKSLESQIKQPFSVVLGLDPTKSEYKWFDREYKVIKSDIVYKEFPQDAIAPV
ncbi:MAG: hypothetical protein PVJ05_08545 [Candidatus Thorarchaeota archaeon]|jgi:hypothetical protein